MLSLQAVKEAFEIFMCEMKGETAVITESR